jgi:hypothetical protein
MQRYNSRNFSTVDGYQPGKMMGSQVESTATRKPVAYIFSEDLVKVSDPTSMTNLKRYHECCLINRFSTGRHLHFYPPIGTVLSLFIHSFMHMDF